MLALLYTVDAIMNVKTTYKISKNWVGDPCGPKNFSWEGLTCKYNDSLPPRIISVLVLPL